MRSCISILLCCLSALAADIPLSWTLVDTNQVSRIDAKTNGVVALSKTVTGTNTVFTLPDGFVYEVSAVTLSKPNWQTNSDGMVYSTNYLAESKPSNIARVATDGGWTSYTIGSGVTLHVPVSVPEPEPEPEPVIAIFQPTDDAYLDDGRRFNDGTLKVEAGRRVSYLKFVVSGLTGTITNARLTLSENGDPGSGTMWVYRGSHSNWTESSLSQSNAPTVTEQLGLFSGSISRGQVVNIDVTPLLAINGTHTLIIAQDQGGNDVWFGSKESTLKPQLLIKTIP